VRLRLHTAAAAAAAARRTVLVDELVADEAHVLLGVPHARLLARLGHVHQLAAGHDGVEKARDLAILRARAHARRG
jgi:hypothetical protein